MTTASMPMVYGPYITHESFNIKQSTLHHSLNIAFISISCPQYSTMSQRIYFLHGASGFLSLSTLCDIIYIGIFTSLPEIYTKLVRKYPLLSAAMVHGHLYQTRRHNGSTRSSPVNPPAMQSPPFIRT